MRVNFQQLIKSCGTLTNPATETKSIGLPANPAKGGKGAKLAAFFEYHLTVKGIARASSDVGLKFNAYNLRRIGNILTRDQLIEYLRILVSMFFGKLHLLRQKKQLF